MKGKTVLVVDDDAEMTGLVRDILAKEEYEVILAHDGLRAIEKSNQMKIDLILLDIRMPFFSGFWFCDAFKKKENTQNIPVIVISGLTGEENVKKAYEMGACDFVKKPFRAEELLEAVQKAIA